MLVLYNGLAGETLVDPNITGGLHHALFLVWATYGYGVIGSCLLTTVKNDSAWVRIMMAFPDFLSECQ